MTTGAMDSGWYYARRGGPPGQQTGPVSWEELVSQARGGAFAPDDLVWQEQLGDWRPASLVPGLFDAPAPAYTQPAAHTPQAAYAAPAGYGAVQPAKSKLLYWLLPLIAVIVVGAGLGAYFGFFYNKDAAFAQQEGEILLEPSGVAGPDSFAGEQFVVVGPSTTLSIPNPQVTLPQISTTATAAPTTEETTAVPTTAAPTTEETTTASTMQPTVLVAYTGDTPALYGGSKSKDVADKDKELAFLKQNPDKAAAFCEALNSDPTLRWSGGDKVSPAQLPAYFEELTAMLLTRDTRVTNYGYKNGRPVPRQSVLQAGQLVLVDRYGVPRKRAECGNPLTPPKPSSKPPTYTGPKWPGFNPTTIIVIQQTTIIINDFTVIDITTGGTFGRPAGSEGGSDGPPPTGGTTDTTTPPVTDTTVTTGSSATDTTATSGGGGPVGAADLNGVWSGTMTITEFDLPPELLEGLQGSEVEGCDLSVLEALKGVPLPMEMDMTVDADGTGGTAVMTLDASSLAGESGSSEPQILGFTIQGDTLTFMLPGEGAGTSMTGKLSKQGGTLVITGVLTSQSEGVGMKAEWSIAKQIGG